MKEEDREKKRKGPSRKKMGKKEKGHGGRRGDKEREGP